LAPQQSMKTAASSIGKPLGPLAGRRTMKRFRHTFARALPAMARSTCAMFAVCAASAFAATKR
ncbi:MAG: hypothetical protein ACR2QA_18160, partial [Solirubrobacteraceae bacterium]